MKIGGIIMLIFGLLAYILFFISPAIIGLILSVLGMKKQKNGFNQAGLILNIIAISIQIIRIFILMTKVI